MRLIGYVRVSRVAGREGDSFISPELQRQKISALAAAHDHVVVDWEQDLDQSGGKYDRPGFQAALEAVERGEANGIAVASLDRFARSVTGAADAIRRLDAAGGELLSVRESFDTSNPFGKFARTMMLALAELELDRTRETSRTNAEHTIARGIHICRVAPFGYRKRDDKRLEPDPRTAPVVRELFERSRMREPWSALVAFMDATAPQADGKRWVRQTLHSILSNRVYLGVAYSGSIENPDAHEPIVSRALFEAAQHAGERPALRNNPAMLAGVIRCAGCGKTMTRASDGRRGYVNYVCRRRHADAVCQEPAKISVRRADEHVEAILFEWLERDPVVVESTRADALTEDAVARVEQAESELHAYRDANVVDIVGIASYREGLRARASTLDEARAALRAIQAAADSPLRGVHDLRVVWPDLTGFEKNRLLAAAIQEVRVERAHLPVRAPVGDRITIVWRGLVVADPEDDAAAIATA